VKRSRVLRSAAAMTDIAFLLLLFFMVFSIISMRLPGDLQPPHLDAADLPEAEDQLRLSVTAGGEYWGEEGRTTASEFAERAAELQKVQPGMVPVIAADADAEYHHVEQVIAALREAEADAVGLLVQTGEGSP